MLLVIDVGNTNTVLGIFDGDRMIRDWRIRTERWTTADEYNFLLSGLFAAGGIRPEAIRKTIVSCVVPPIVSIIEGFCRKYLGHAPNWVDARSVSHVMPILYNNPAEVGADRIVNAIAAYKRYPQALIVIDFGTATTFDVISAQGEYVGGAITPGIMVASDALFMAASKLPRVDLFSPPDQVIGRDTADSIKSGIIFGYAGLVDGMVARMSTEMRCDPAPRVIATGGLADLMVQVAETIEIVDHALTLEGLRIISES
ncbi:MAG: pantothenate kinase [Deltaproteobacteria bacterium]|nr:MAG: pantothenate kinase [Deltaproteobacteria bacterium]